MLDERDVFAYFLFAEDNRMMTCRGGKGHPYFRRYGRELVSNPAMSQSESRRGYYRRTTLNKSSRLRGRLGALPGFQALHFTCLMPHPSPLAHHPVPYWNMESAVYWYLFDD